MPLITDARSLAANTIVDNILAGKQWEFLPFNALLGVGITADGPGLFMSVNVAGRLLVDAQEVPTKGAAGTGAWPVFPDDQLFKDFGFQSQKVQITLHNRTGGALLAKTRLQIDPV